jgi:antitoxin component YwqK of YwqJK toxin-antitoxin module
METPCPPYELPETSITEGPITEPYSETQCYLCYDTATSIQPFATNPPPCACHGTIALHRTCLYNILKQKSTCSICKQPYDPYYTDLAATWKPLQEMVEQITRETHLPYRLLDFYHGNHIVYFPSTQKVYCRFTTYEGHLDGTFTSYYKNGQERQRFQYTMDTLHGAQQQWLSTSKPAYYYNYNNGVLEGLQRKWYSNGTLQKSYTTIDGKRTGPYEEWYYVKHIPKIKTTYQHGKLHGHYERWYCDGHAAYVGKWKHGKKEGRHTTFYTSGKRKASFHYKHDRQEGHQEEYHPNGRLQYFYTIKHDKPVGTSYHYNRYGEAI